MITDAHSARHGLVTPQISRRRAAADMYLAAGTYELRTADGGHLFQPSAKQLAAAINALTAPGNTFLCVQPEPDTGWYVEVCLPDPATADVFNGPYELHFQDNDADLPKWIVYGDSPQTVATRIVIWVHSMINSRS